MDAYTDDRAPRRRAATRDTKGTGLPNAVREQQHDMFGKPPGDGRVGPVARTTDPSTSHDAAKRAALNLTVKMLAVLDCLRTMGRALPTHEQVVSAYGYRFARGDDPAKLAAWYPHMTDSSIRTRVSELVTLGYVQKYDEQGRTQAGGRASRWCVTDAGRALDVRQKLHEITHANARKLRNGRPNDNASRGAAR